MARAGPDVVADVGDVHVQGVVAVGQAVDPDGVVEIAGGFAVDGDDGEIAEIAAACEFARRMYAGMPLRLLEHFGRESDAAGGACG